MLKMPSFSCFHHFWRYYLSLNDPTIDSKRKKFMFSDVPQRRLHCTCNFVELFLNQWPLTTVFWQKMTLFVVFWSRIYRKRYLRKNYDITFILMEIHIQRLSLNESSNFHNLLLFFRIDWNIDHFYIFGLILLCSDRKKLFHLWYLLITTPLEFFLIFKKRKT